MNEWMCPMFNKLKKSLENFVADTVTDFVEAADPNSAPPSTSEASIAQDGIPEMDLPSFERVHKAPAVYEPISSLPTDDIPKLIEALDDPDPQQQVHAIQMAHHIMKKNPSQIYTICETLTLVLMADSDAPARAAAAEALNVIKKPEQRGQHTEAQIEFKMQNERYKEVQDALVTALQEDDDLLTRQNAAETLTHIGVRNHAAFAKIWNTEKDDLDPFLTLHTLIHVNPVVIANTLRRMNDADRKPLEDMLLQAYVDYPALQQDVLTTMEQLQLCRAVPYVFKKYLSHKDVPLRSTLAVALGKFECPEALEPLLYIMREDQDVSAYAIEGLGYLKDERAIAPLKAYKASLEAPGATLISAIDKTLIQCGDTSGLQEHFDNLKSADVARQQAAIAALGAAGGDAAVDALIDYLKTTRNSNMAYEVLRVIVKHPSDKVAHALIDRVCAGVLGYRQVSHNLVANMKMTHALRWLDKAVDERATPEAKVQIEKDRAQLKRF